MRNNILIWSFKLFFLANLVVKFRHFKYKKIKDSKFELKYLQIMSQLATNLPTFTHLATTFYCKANMKIKTKKLTLTFVLPGKWWEGAMLLCRKTQSQLIQKGYIIYFLLLNISFIWNFIFALISCCASSKSFLAKSQVQLVSSKSFK